MQSLFRKTRTQVHSPKAQRIERERGLLSGAHAAAAIQLGTQIILWIFFFAYDRTAQTVWQAAILLFVPLSVIWLVWRSADASLPTSKRWLLLLLPCLLLDAVFLIYALSGFIGQLIPNYPLWVTALIPSACCASAALRARARGVKYGALVLIAPLVILLVFGTVFLRASTRADRLWPIWGDGFFSTARTALTGAGAVWGAALLFANAPSKRSAGWTLAPWLIGVLCALWFGFLKPWAPGDALPVAEKMMGLARHAHSVILYEMSGVLWMLLIPSALTACFSASGELIRGAFPRMKEWLSLLIVPSAALAPALIRPEIIFPVLTAALPWRFVPALALGVILMIIKRRAR